MGAWNAIGVGGDITDPTSAADMAKDAKAKYGGVDPRLRNNAALMVEIERVKDRSICRSISGTE